MTKRIYYATHILQAHMRIRLHYGYQITHGCIMLLHQLRRPADVWDAVRDGDEGRQAEEGGPRHHCLTQRPRQYHRDVLSDEADRRQRKLL